MSIKLNNNNNNQKPVVRCDKLPDTHFALVDEPIDILQKPLFIYVKFSVILRNNPDQQQPITVIIA